MSEPVSALGGVTWADGIAQIAEIGPQGMITLRGDFDDPEFRVAVKNAVGLDMPGQRAVQMSGENTLCWMSPDELLVLCPYGDVAAMLAALTSALAGHHALAVNVSDARAVFRVTGPYAREIMAKLTPADLAPDAFKTGMFRRTRMAQVPAAFFLRETDSFEIVCFRSVAQYMFDLLKTAAQPGSEVGYF
ncbi:sarcosine oxidase subunit gamma [Aliishimia ponticola]|uniref:Sarcosine oxidase subunit gamma n=1 Tax=Aliishimia ponticola TaxID=2499833 RepID=A0A4S4NF94_9RHOB|nr:sarcosine oxidase subunit gamma family protein [Aliishimia ponticola]THH38242.1 sarcosine oxidase subunit gamma [Aliishimia ponticola]